MRKTLAADLKQQIDKQAPRFKAVEQTVVPASKVVELLEHLLARTARCNWSTSNRCHRRPWWNTRVIRKRHPARLPDVYSHGVEIAVTGSYADLLAPSAARQKSPQRVSNT